MMARLLQEWASSLNTPCEATESLNAATKHCSALTRLPVRSSANEYSPVISALKISQKSLSVAYKSSLLYELLACAMAFICPSWLFTGITNKTYGNRQYFDFSIKNIRRSREH